MSGTVTGTYASGSLTTCNDNLCTASGSVWATLLKKQPVRASLSEDVGKVIAIKTTVAWKVSS